MLKSDKLTGDGCFEVIGRAVPVDGAGRLLYGAHYLAVYQIRDGSDPPCNVLTMASGCSLSSPFSA